MVTWNIGTMRLGAGQSSSYQSAFAFVEEKSRNMLVYHRIDLRVIFRSIGHTHHFDEFSTTLNKSFVGRGPL